MKKKKSDIAIGILVSLILMMGVAIVADENSISNIMGNVVYEDQLNLNQEGYNLLPAIANEKTSEGLVIRYGELKQDLIEIGKPVKWFQEVRVSNLNNEEKTVYLNLQTPLKSFNHFIRAEKNISNSSVIEIKNLKPNEETALILSFETDPVMIEIIEDGTKIFNWKDIVDPDKDTITKLLNGRSKQLRVWHNSPMTYHNIVVEMDLLLGEKVLKLVENSEQNLEFDYDNGKARWLIKEL